MTTGAGSTTLNLGTLANPAVGANYNTTSPYFYGATYSSGATPQFLVMNFTSNDRLTAQAANLTALTTLYVWTQDYFQTGYTSGNLSLNSISTSFADNTGSITTLARYVIRLGTDFYVSDTVSETATPTVASLTDPSSVSWYSYNPTSAIGTVGSSVTLSNFDNLTAAGLLLSSTRASETYMANYVYAFSVGATPIPEPSSAMLLGLSAVALVLRRRQKA
ncbi:MAG: PEP-CTERM sorting domain-containing protein [Chthoniobacterales bacterium]